MKLYLLFAFLSCIVISNAMPTMEAQQQNVAAAPVASTEQSSPELSSEQMEQLSSMMDSFLDFDVAGEGDEDNTFTTSQLRRIDDRMYRPNPFDRRIRYERPLRRFPIRRDFSRDHRFRYPGFQQPIHRFRTQPFDRRITTQPTDLRSFGFSVASPLEQSNDQLTALESDLSAASVPFFETSQFGGLNRFDRRFDDRNSFRHPESRFDSRFDNRFDSRRNDRFDSRFENRFAPRFDNRRSFGFPGRFAVQSADENTIVPTESTQFTVAASNENEVENELEVDNRMESDFESEQQSRDHRRGRRGLRAPAHCARNTYSRECCEFYSTHPICQQKFGRRPLRF